MKSFQAFRVSTLTVAIVGTITIAAAANDAARQPPSIEKFIAGLKSTEDALETLKLTCVCLEKVNFVKPGTKPPAVPLIEDDDSIAMTRKALLKWEVARDGRGRMEASIRKTNERPNGTKVIRDETILSTFNGGAGQWSESRDLAGGKDAYRHTQSTADLRRTHELPFEFSTQHLGVPISKLLVEGEAKIVESERWEGRPVVVVDINPRVVREDYISYRRFWIDSERNAAVRRQVFVERGKGKPRALHHQVDAKEYAEVSPGIWLPKKVEIRNYHVTEKGQDFLVSKSLYEISRWKVNEKVDPTRFEQ